MFKKENFQQFQPTPEQRKFVTNHWSRFYDLWELKNEPLDILGGVNLQTFWDNSNLDYSVLTGTATDANDPVKQYTSPISRDKSDIFISQLTGLLLTPTVIAQNPEQQIDVTVSKISKPLLEWLYQNDGYPSENGHQKTSRGVHKMVVEGTVHIQDNFSVEGLESEMVPNEEIFIPNLWQPDIQKQSRLYRAKLNVNYDEAEADFGNLPNWKYVMPGFTDWWYVQRPKFKDQWNGIIKEESLQIIYVWTPCTNKELQDLKKSGRVPKNAKKAKWFNILINDIPMLPLDTLSPYKDGFYPINKGKFCNHAKAEFYWGNSLPNKIRQDKIFLDGWKTLLRYKAKKNALPPLLSRNGVFIDEEILLPGKITATTDNVKLEKIDGISEPINQSDVEIMNMAKEDIENSTKSPQLDIKASAKATNASIVESNSQKIMNAFVMEVSFLQQARSFPILMRAFQFLPRRTISKISISDYMLSDGTVGSLEVIWKKLPKMTKSQRLAASYKLKEAEDMAKEEGMPKEITYLDPDYVRNLNYYLKSGVTKETIFESELKKAEFNERMPFLMQYSDVLNRKRVMRRYLQVNNEDEGLLAPDEQPMQEGGSPKVTPNQMPNQPQPIRPMQSGTNNQF